MRSLIEPFKIKMVEPIRMTTEDERRARIREAGYNVFLLHARDVMIDLLTDSGTSAMSSEQWAAMMRGDEAYAGSESFYRFEAAVQRRTGMPYVIPTHQGRAAEHLLFELMVEPGQVVISNTHFDTTRANVEARGAEAIDLPCAAAADLHEPAPFKGDMDLDRLDATLGRLGSKVALVIMTVTNNAAGGQPVSMANLRGARAVCDRHKVPMFLDACRFAENAWFIKTREPGHADRPLADVAREMFDHVDGCTMSAKKDGLVNMGGFLALRDKALSESARGPLILTEGFPTYGGLSGRDLDAIAQGLEEVVDEDYMRYRVRTAAFLSEHLESVGVPTVLPPGGHAVYVDARRMLPHIPLREFPGLALVNALYVHAGVRAVEVGGVMFGRTDKTTGEYVEPPVDLVRLALPRRVYTQSHIEYVAEALEEVNEARGALRGYRFTWEAPRLRHFTSRFEPLS
ncbi:MAG: tryptophanase [Myxococcales bacterium]